MRGSGNINNLAALVCLLWMAMPVAADCACPAGQSAMEPAVAYSAVKPAQNQAEAYHPGQAADTLPAILKHPLVAGTESVIIVTDRETYIAGENVWFVMNAGISGKHNIPRSLAGYAEILNPSGMPVAQCRILLDGNGTGNGLLVIPDSVSSGDYLLRGYTRAMTSFGPEYFFTRIIRVFNPYNLGTSYTAVIPEQCPPGPAVELFPEGGSLIFGRPARVVVRTTGPDRTGIAARVILFTGEGPAADTVMTGSNGLGSALITADATGRLRAEALIDSTVVRSRIYSYRSAGYSLALTPVPGGGTGITVIHAEGETSPSNTWLNIAVINNKGLIFFRKFRPGSGDDNFNLSEIISGEGISECLLYDNSGNLISSRLFMNSGILPGSGIREDVTLEVTGKTLKVKLPEDSMRVTLSASITGGDHLPCQGNHILLSSWVTAGTLADPFIRTFLSGNVAIPDELLITLRDKYTDMNHDRADRVIAETMGLAVDCSVTGLGEQMPAAGKRLFINLPGKACFLQYAVSNSEGLFTFIVPPRTGTGEIVIYPEDTTENLSIRVFPPFFTEAIPLRRSPRDLQSAADETVTRMSMNSQVMRIYQVSETDTAALTTDSLRNSHFYGKPDKRLVIADYIALPEMEEFFFELVPGWNLVRTRSGYEFRLFDPVTGNEIKTTPLMFIDGTCTTDPGTIARLSPYITEYVDVCESYYRLGAVLLPPVVSVVTLKGDSRQQVLPPQSLRISYRFSNQEVNFRPFRGDVSGHMPRFSNTLLWVPETKPGQGRELSFLLPESDTNSPVSVCLTISGSDGQPRFYTRTLGADRN